MAWDYYFPQAGLDRIFLLRTEQHFFPFLTLCFNKDSNIGCIDALVTSSNNRLLKGLLRRYSYVYIDDIHFSDETDISCNADSLALSHLFYE